MQAGTLYTTPAFTPLYTFTGVSGWQLQAPAGLPDSPAMTTFVGPRDHMTIVVIRPDRAITEGGAAVIPVPELVGSWLWSRTDLDTSVRPTTFGMPPSIILNGQTGADIAARVVSGAAVNSGGVINMLCAPGLPCAWNGVGPLGIRSDAEFRLIVLGPQHQQVVILETADASTWSADKQDLDALLNSITFPK
jgi:hypothetical protein